MALSTTHADADTDMDTERRRRSRVLSIKKSTKRYVRRVTERYGDVRRSTERYGQVRNGMERYAKVWRGTAVLSASVADHGVTECKQHDLP